jgi:hypothetical protein
MSHIIYDGPSLLDGKPIVAIALQGKSNNDKTGDMVQTYILCKDTDPRIANKNGLDYSICGDCIHRGIPHNDPKKKLAKKRTCYVFIGQGPVLVYKAYKAGKYIKITTHKDISEIGDGRSVRLGTYGDPSAVPAYVWESLLSKSSGHTAYSHQKDIENADFQPKFMMESADTLKQAMDAWSKDHRTYRTIASMDEIVKGKEILCPASKEAGRRTQCTKCLLCSGSQIKAKSIAIVVHGNGAVHYTQ